MYTYDEFPVQGTVTLQGQKALVWAMRYWLACALKAENARSLPYWQDAARVQTTADLVTWAERVLKLIHMADGDKASKVEYTRTPTVSRLNWVDSDGLDQTVVMEIDLKDELRQPSIGLTWNSGKESLGRAFVDDINELQS